MKTIKSITMKAAGLLALTLLFALPTKAQMTDNCYLNLDWQYNFPLGNNFTDNSSGWGMAMESGYFLTEHYAMGLFVNFHSNHEYVGRQTLPAGDNGSLTTDQQHTTFQLPFGVASRYAWNRGGVWQPYIGSKIGAQYAKFKSDFSAFTSKKKTWGFYLSTELGVNIFPRAYGPGLHLAAYYSYGSNDANLMAVSVNGLHNVGLRVGLAF